MGYYPLIALLSRWTDLDLRGISGEKAHQQAIATQQKIESERELRDRPFSN